MGGVWRGLLQWAVHADALLVDRPEMMSAEDLFVAELCY